MRSLIGLTISEVAALTLLACGGGSEVGGGISCPASQISCAVGSDVKCVDPLSDRTFCGASDSCQGTEAGTSCGSGEVCANGTCATSCPPDQRNCGGTCITPATDRDHCGASGSCLGALAGAGCGEGQVCAHGACATSCPADQVVCDGKCINPKNDNVYCDADTSCQAFTNCSTSGLVCANGACATSCPTGQVSCGGKCIDPLTSRFFCNADRSCQGYTDCSLSGQVCGNGACATSCPTGQVDCGGKCVDPTSDHAYCGANASCTVFTSCGAGQLCVNGACTTSCPTSMVKCGDRCIDPLSSGSFCGANQSCENYSVCGAGSFCNAGTCWSPCGTGLAFCDGQCVDPSSNRGRCGASGLCSGVAEGVSCQADQVCGGATCACPDRQRLCDDGTCQFVCPGAANRPGWEWKASVPLTAPPRFPEPADPASLIAHIVWDGTTNTMRDSTGHTTWTPAVASPPLPSASNGVWSPAQVSSGPFSATAYWIGDAASRDYLRTATSGPFMICARYRPGAHPGQAASKVVMALGKPDPMSGTTVSPGGWALLQMQDFAGFRYNGAVGGDWIVYSSWPVDSTTLASTEWTWHCGGWDGSHIRALRESVYATNDSPYNFHPGPQLEAGFPATLDLPAIGNYADGTAPLSDGTIYEIIITGDAATEDGVKALVARASGALRSGNEAPVELVGADGRTHRGAPSTVRVEADGSILADQDLLLPVSVSASFDPVPGGQCWGVDASVADWTNFGADNNLLKWTSADSSHEFRMNWRPGTTMCMAAVQISPFDDRFACQNYGAIAGGRHRFHYCITPERTMRMYVDGTQFGPDSVAIPLDFLPHVESPGAQVSLTDLTSSVKVWRVWACATSDPASCP